MQRMNESTKIMVAKSEWKRSITGFIHSNLHVIARVKYFCPPVARLVPQNRILSLSRVRPHKSAHADSFNDNLTLYLHKTIFHSFLSRPFVHGTATLLTTVHSFASLVFQGMYDVFIPNRRISFTLNFVFGR